jgi:hypothetical protein
MRSPTCQAIALIASILTLLASGCESVPASPQRQSMAPISVGDLNTVTVINRTGETLAYLFVSPGDSKSWGPDLLGASYVFEPDTSFKFNVHYPDNSNRFDTLAVATSGQYYELRGVEIVDGQAKTITIDRALRKGEREFKMSPVEVLNRTQYDLLYLFFSPADSKMWGADLLNLTNTGVLKAGGTFTFLLPTNPAEKSYRVCAVDEDGDTYTFFATITGASENLRLTIDPEDLD